ncbi:MAG TPA: DMT family transporter [Anaerolineales bacterium]|nr:DMT family transporter [Anaerolineales bacterium]
MKTRLNILPYLALGAVIVCLGFSAIFVRLANAPGPVSSFYRLAFAAVILTPFAVYRLAKRQAMVSRRGLIFPLIGGTFSAIDFTFWSLAVNMTIAGNATLLGNAAPLWVALFAWLVLRERLRGRFWLGLVLTLGGAVLVMGSDFFLHPVFGLGDILAISSSVFYAGYFLATQRGREYLDPLTYVWLSACTTALGLLAVNLVMHYPLTGYPLQSWLVFLASAIISQTLGYLAMSYALGHLPASIVSPTMIGQPVLTTILAIPILGEVPAAWQIAGGILVLAGILLIHQAHNQQAGTSP